jgi:hypothetical protein
LYDRCLDQPVGLFRRDEDLIFVGDPEAGQIHEQGCLFGIVMWICVSSGCLPSAGWNLTKAQLVLYSVILFSRLGSVDPFHAAAVSRA